MGGLAAAPMLSEAEGEDVAVERIPLVRRRGRRGGRSGGGGWLDNTRELVHCLRWSLALRGMQLGWVLFFVLLWRAGDGR